MASEQLLEGLLRTARWTRLRDILRYCRYRRVITRRVARVARPVAHHCAAAAEATSTRRIVAGRAPRAPLRPVRSNPLLIGTIVSHNFRK